MAKLPTTYRQLLKAVRSIFVEGRFRAEQAVQAVQRKRLPTYHKVGRSDQHAPACREWNRTVGRTLYQRLSEDLGVADRLLRDEVSLYRWHPTLRARGIGLDALRDSFPMPNTET